MTSQIWKITTRGSYVGDTEFAIKSRQQGSFFDFPWIATRPGFVSLAGRAKSYESALSAAKKACNKLFLLEES